jgi:hypothetical protein
MPFLFIIVGTVFVVASVRNTNQQLVTLLKGDFTGSRNFIYWTLSILLIGMVGYVKDLQPISRMFMALVVIVLFLSNEGVFNKFFSAINATQSQSAATGTTAQMATGTNLGNVFG